MPSTPDHWAPQTEVVTLGRPDRAPGEPVNVPVVLTSTYIAGGPVNYGRSGNPTWTAFEEIVGGLEGGVATAFASGLAAVDAVLSLVPVGGVVVAPANAYNGVVVGLTERAEAGLVEVRWVDQLDVPAVTAALDGAALLWLESPTNPLLDVADIGRLAELGRAAGALVAVDNTFATPLLQKPLDLGADIVVHSATKYLSGHSDLLLGVVVTGLDERGQELTAAIQRHRLLRGAIPGPFETWLAVRGVRTLALRLRQAATSAADLVHRLEGHPAVERVRYPGFGAMLSIDVRGGAIGADRVAQACRLWVHSTSLGGVESQLERRRAQPGEPETTPVNLLRLSVGIEDVDDLWRDLAQALAHA